MCKNLIDDSADFHVASAKKKSRFLYHFTIFYFTSRLNLEPKKWTSERRNPCSFACDTSVAESTENTAEKSHNKSTLATILLTIVHRVACIISSEPSWPSKEEVVKMQHLGKEVINPNGNIINNWRVFSLKATSLCWNHLADMNEIRKYFS